MKMENKGTNMFGKQLINVNHLKLCKIGYGLQLYNSSKIPSDGWK